MKNTGISISSERRKCEGRPLRSRLAGMSAMLVASVAMSVPAIAQEEAETVEEASSRRLTTVTVTARKVEENLQEVPVAVTAFTGELLQESGVVDFGDIAAYTPSLTTVDSSSNAAALALSLRGQVQNDVASNLEPSVGTYVDGVYWARAVGLNADLLDVASVQVLKGPQGTLFGRNTTGGALVIETANPNFDGASGSIEGTVGSYNARGAKAIVNVPLIEDVLAVRGALSIDKRDGYVTDPFTGRKWNDKDNMTGRVKALFAPTENIEFTLSGEWFEFQTDGRVRGTVYVDRTAGTGGSRAAGIPQSYVDLVNTGNLDIATNVDQFVDVTTETFTANFKWDVGPGELKLTAGNRTTDSKNLLDLDGSAEAIHATSQSAKLEQNTLDVQWTASAIDDRLNYVVGAGWMEDKGFDRSTTNSVVGFRGDLDNISWGVYTQGTFDVTDRLGITAGVRYSEDEKGLTSNTTLDAPVIQSACFLYFGAGGVSLEDCPQTDTATFDSTDYTLGADFHVTDTTMVYAKFSTGYRAGGLPLRIFTIEEFVPFNSESVEEIEIGMKGDFLDERLRINLAVYQSKLSDAQRSTVVDAGGVSQSIVSNMDIENTGLEVDIVGVVNDNVQLTVSGSLLDSENKTSELARIYYTPEENLSAAIDYNRPMSFGEFNAKLSYAWTSEYNTSDVNDPNNPENDAIVVATSAPSSGQLNGRIGVKFDNAFGLTLWGTNILDDDAVNAGLYVPTYGYVTGEQRQPRMFGITGTYRFGG